jgi:hypothetical protein
MGGLLPMAGDDFFINDCPPAPKPVRSGSIPKAPTFRPKYEPDESIELRGDIEGMD